MTGTTPQGKPVAYLVRGDTKSFAEPEILLKAYPNEDGTKLRILIPTLKSFAQSKIDIDSHYIEVIL